MANLELFQKRPAHELSQKRRFERLTADDVVKSCRLKKVVLVLAIKLRRSKNKGDIDTQLKMKRLLRLTLYQYLKLTYHVPDALPLPIRLDRTIDSFSVEDCPLFFRFSKNHLYELYELLGLKDLDEIEENNGSKFVNGEQMRAEEVILRALYI